MKNFIRALKEVAQFWRSLALALCCSLCVAALWGTNIAALYPVIETTLQGRSLQTWNRERGELAEKQVAEFEQTLSQLKPGREAENIRGRLHTAQATVYSAARLQPLLDRWLPHDPFQTVVVILAFIVLGTLLKQSLSVISVALVARAAQGVARSIRVQIFDRAVALDRATFNQYGTSGFSSHLTQTTDMLAHGLASMYNGAISEPLRICACLVGALYISWRLTLVSLVFAPLAAFALVGVNRRLRALSHRMLDRSIGFHHVLLEVFRALTTVQAYTMEPFERVRFDQSTRDMRRAALKSNFLQSLANPLTEVFGIMMLCTGLTASAWLVISQQTTIFGIPMTDRPLTASSAIIFFGMLLGAADPLRKMSHVITSINTGMVAANLLYPLLDLRSRVSEPSTSLTFPTSREIEFVGVTFGYDEHTTVLKQVDLKIPAGERVAIVGPNGGGKSTLVNLLCRFYDPQQGEVRLGGVSLKKLPIADLRRRIALVTQETELFNESVLHNIRYGRWSATHEEILAAAKLARAHDFVSAMPEGYNTIVGPNGQRLSGGQRQRIALARALLRNADILVLDEATSQIDADSEREIHAALASLPRSSTVLMITHRESTLALATTIVHIDRGTLIVQSPIAERRAA